MPEDISYLAMNKGAEGLPSLCGLVVDHIL